MSIDIDIAILDEVEQLRARADQFTGVRAPNNIAPLDGGSVDSVVPELVFTPYRSMYGAPYGATQLQVSASADFSAPAYDSGELPSAQSFASVPSGVVAASTTYYWRVRHKSIDGDWSSWSEPTSFTTAAILNDYIARPADTPAYFGDPLEGGFYAGMVWNQITQSASSKNLATGAQSFTVPSMASAAIAYYGQQLEIRSRANPANKFIGTVTSAKGTTLSVNVSRVEGSGTFSDWSVMARYRIIVAPKASGEHPGIALKNANTALPTDCQTLNEGWLATEAMKNADTSAVYPAAHWARSLSINGRSDWYVPARDELELLWRNLKPTSDDNYTSNRAAASSYNYGTNGAYNDTSTANGLNTNSAPPGAAYSATSPSITGSRLFVSGGSEAFAYGGSETYWSSTDYAATGAWAQRWYQSGAGLQNSTGKSAQYRVRAVRRSII